MRIVVIGLGAIGGSVAAPLALAGGEVLGVARGAHLAAIRERGLRFRTPGADRVARFPTVASVAEIAFRPDDAILIATKTQHVTGVLDELAAAGVTDQPIFCAQNGVTAERMALRRFPNVHGICVMLPAEYMTPGEVAAFGRPNHGIFDIGRFPGGFDEADEALARALAPAGIAGFVMPDVMASKYGKLLMNLNNVLDAALGAAAEATAIRKLLRDEAEAVLAAAGIAWHDVGLGDPRRTEHMVITEIDGLARHGSSSTQSLLRGTGDIETDYMNGEIALIARMNGIEAPANAWMMRLARRLLAGEVLPGKVGRAEIEAGLGIAA